MRRLLVLAVLVSALAISIAPRAALAAEPITAEAKRVLDEGLALYEARAYEQALAAFRRGYALDPHPDFLYAMAQAERLSGDCRAAAQDYRRFLQAQPPEHEASLARENLTKCEQANAADEPIQPPIEAPVESPIAPPPPAILPIALPAEVAPPPAQHAAEATKPPSFWSDPASMTLASFALAAASAGGVLLTLGELSAQSAASAPDLTTFSDDVATTRELRIAGGTLLGAGVVSACISAIRWGVLSASPPNAAAAPAATLTTLFSARGGFVALELEL